LTSLSFNDFYFFLNPVWFLSGLWIFFFKMNSNFNKISSEKSSHINIIKINSNKTFIGFYYYLIFFNIMYIYTLHGKNLLLWFSHFNINNFTISLLYFFLLVSFTIYFLLNSLTKKSNLFKSIDYLFSLNNLILILPYLFFVNTVFTFLFLLELISVVLLYKLISSKIWFKNFDPTKYLNNSIPQNYINMVFFQYWVTFFSTIFIVYFYINIFYIYGTSDWFLIQFLHKFEIENQMASTNMIRLLISIFLISIFFKLGITPLHLFKVEVYKGIPFLSIFFYTTYYFIIFFIFFIFFLLDFLSLFVIQYYAFLVFIIFVGILYVMVLLFDVNLLKAFFTYSTIINTIGFMISFITLL